MLTVSLEELKKKVNMKAFSIILDRENDTLLIKYKGIIVHKMEWKERFWDEGEHNLPEPLIHYIIVQGRDLYDALQTGNITEAILFKAIQIETKKVGIEDPEEWKSSDVLNTANPLSSIIKLKAQYTPFLETMFSTSGTLQYIEENRSDNVSGI